MRLGGTGSSGYGQHAASVAATRRRKSAVEAMGGVGGATSAAASHPSSSAFLRPPAAMSARGRRFSDSLNLMAAATAQQSRSKSRKGGERMIA